MNERFLTVKEVASKLGVDPETVRRWVRVGQMPAVALSRRGGYRVRAEDFAQFVTERAGRTVRDVEREGA